MKLLSNPPRVIKRLESEREATNVGRKSTKTEFYSCSTEIGDSLAKKEKKIGVQIALIEVEDLIDVRRADDDEVSIELIFGEDFNEDRKSLQLKFDEVRKRLNVFF